MITPKEFANRWIDSPLIRLKDEDVAHLPIPDASKAFLTQAGLPERPTAFIRCDILRETFAPVGKVLPSAEFPRETENCYLLAVHAAPGCTCLCMDVENGGEIVSVIADSDEPKRFANSSVMHLAEFFLAIQELQHEMSLYESYEDSATLYDAYIQGLVNGDPGAVLAMMPKDEQIADFVDALRAKFLQVDPEALVRKESFWSIQLWDFLL